MSVCASNSYSVSQQNQFNPVKENNKPAKSGSLNGFIKFDGSVDWCLVGVVSVLALTVIGSIAAGITLITLGALSANPLFLQIGIYLVAIPIITLIGSALGVKTNYYWY